MRHARFQVLALAFALLAALRPAQAAPGPVLEVERLPMVPPKHLVPSGIAEFGFDAQFLTPVNWVLMPGKAYVPVFPEWMSGLPAGEADQLTGALTRAFAARGRTVVPVPATRLLAYNGLVHCLTGQLKLD